MSLACRWYQPHLERLHDNPGARTADLDQLEQIAGIYSTRSSFLTELTLDPPEATSAEGAYGAASPVIDELGYDLVDTPGVSMDETVFESLDHA